MTKFLIFPGASQQKLDEIKETIDKAMKKKEAFVYLSLEPVVIELNDL